MPDHALREALRHLQLSPEIIDKSMAAIYKHARNPSGHPVDKDLDRLCTSEYDRGALCALASYIAATTSLCSPGNNARSTHSRIKSSAEQDGTSKMSTRTDGCNGPPRADSWTPDGASFVLKRSLGDTARNTDSSIVHNRLRRIRSMPTGDYSVNCRDKIATYPSALADKVDLSCLKSNLHVRITAVPRELDNGLSIVRMESSMSGLVEQESSARRAPVRTGRWKLGHEIGKGSFGVVHIGLNEDSGDLIAVKVLSLPHVDAVEPLYREIELMQQLTHPNIVCYLGAEVNDSEKTISIFQEWVPGSVTTLLVNFGPFSDRRIACYTKQILHGLKYLHQERVVHRDIKGGNILIDNRGVVKLCDFGASKMLDKDTLTGVGDHTRVGSPLFMAPEILLREEYGPPVDIWSLGGAVLEMATGHPPWHTLNLRTPVALINWVRSTEGPPPLPAELSESLKGFLLRCFQRDPLKRATASELLADPFLRDNREDSDSLCSGGEDDVVSDINNLSRAAAIARIRRASLSDFTRSPRGVMSHQPPSCARVSRSSYAGRRHSGGNVVALRREGDSPASKASGRVAIPSLEVATSGLDPPTPSSGTPRVTTPPRRKSFGMRGGSTSPNPFGRRKRSIDSDSSRSPRNSLTSSPSVSALSNASVCMTSPTRDGTEHERESGSSCGACSPCSPMGYCADEQGDPEPRSGRVLSSPMRASESPSEIALDEIAESVSNVDDDLKDLDDRPPRIGWNRGRGECRTGSSASSISSNTSDHIVAQKVEERNAVADPTLLEVTSRKPGPRSDTGQGQVSPAARRRRCGRGGEQYVNPPSSIDVAGDAICAGDQ